MSTKVDYVRSAILKLREDPGSRRIPPERQLAEQLGINHRTVRRALEELVNEGIVEKRSRVGNFFRQDQGIIPIALVLPTFFFGRPEGQHTLIGGALEALHETLDPLRYQVSTLPYDPERFEEEVVRPILERKIQGCLMSGHYRVPPAAVATLQAAGVKIVLLTQHQPLVELGIPAVYGNMSMTVLRLLYGLIERGRRKISIVRYTHPSFIETDIAIEVAAREHQLGDAEKLVTQIPNADGKVDFRPLEQLLLPENRPEAVIVPDEVAAGRLFREAYRQNLRIPDDLLVAAVTDMTPEAHPVPLTAPDSPALTRRQMALAAQELSGLIEGKPAAPFEISVRRSVIWRESTGDGQLPRA